MSYRLFLDDIRNPDYVGCPLAGTMVVRSSLGFMETIRRKGIPAVVSFDHDLGPESMDGYWCLKWLLLECDRHGVGPDDITINCHSANPVGRENILKYYECWLRIKKDV